MHRQQPAPPHPASRPASPAILAVLAAWAVLFVLAAALPARADTIRLGTLDWEPYVGRSLPGQGYVAEVVREGLRRAGHDAEFVFYPWARTVREARDGNLDGYFPEYSAREVARDFRLSRPFPGGPLGFFALRDRHIAWKTLEDLRPYSIGVVRGYVNSGSFDRAGFLRKEEAVDDLTNLRKLAEGRLDLVVADKHVGLRLAARRLGAHAASIVFLDPPLTPFTWLHACFSRARPGSARLAEDFDKALAAMAVDGSIDRIMAAHGLK